MKYNKVNFGQIEAVLNKLGGNKGIEDFLSCRTKVVKSEKYFPTLKIMEVGICNPHDLPKIINGDKTIETDENTKGIFNWLPSFQFYEKTEIELVVVTPRDLGFEEMFKSCATYENICTRAVEYGLGECPNELGMLLSLPEHRLTNDSFFFVASKLMKNELGKGYFFVLWFNKENCELKAWEVENGKTNDKAFDLGFKFIFCRLRIVI